MGTESTESDAGAGFEQRLADGYARLAEAEGTGTTPTPGDDALIEKVRQGLGDALDPAYYERFLDTIRARLAEAEHDRDEALRSTFRLAEETIDERARAERAEAALREGRCKRCGEWFRDSVALEQGDE